MAALNNALIIGGGIGGLAAGVALRRAGVKVDLIETKADLGVYGVGIIQPNNTLRALDKIGLARRCVEAGAPFPGWRIYDEAGRFLMDVPNSNSAAPGFPPVNGITRPELHEILTEAALDADVAIHLDTRIAMLSQADEEVAVVLSDGTEARYDLVIGCDGIYSDTRRRLFGEAAMPRNIGQSVWRYNLYRPAHVDRGRIYYGSNSKVGLVPLGPELMYMFLVTSEPGNPHMPADQLARLMQDRLSPYAGYVAELREQVTDPAKVVYKGLENLLLPAPWMKGRVIIIGDAAHATTPHLAQGAAMAIEDAVLLGELLARNAPVDTLLDEFMRRRFERAQLVVDSSGQLAAWEMEEWRGGGNFAAQHGQLIHEANTTLMEEY